MTTTQGAKSGGELESAQAKNQALKEAGAVVPTSYEALEGAIQETFQKLVCSHGTFQKALYCIRLLPQESDFLRGISVSISGGGREDLRRQRDHAPPDPGGPEHRHQKRKSQSPHPHHLHHLGRQRSAAAFRSTHLWPKNESPRWPQSPFTGEEPSYAGIPMSTIVEKGYGVGDVISLLWFKRSLPRYCTQFIEVNMLLFFSAHPQKFHKLGKTPRISLISPFLTRSASCYALTTVPASPVLTTPSWPHGLERTWFPASYQVFFNHPCNNILFMSLFGSTSVISIKLGVKKWGD